MTVCLGWGDYVQSILTYFIFFLYSVILKGDEAADEWLESFSELGDFEEALELLFYLWWWEDELSICVKGLLLALLTYYKLFSCEAWLAILLPGDWITISN